MKNIKVAIKLDKNNFQKELNQLLKRGYDIEVNNINFKNTMEQLKKLQGVLKDTNSNNVFETMNDSLKRTKNEAEKLTNSMSKLEKLQYNLQIKLDTAQANKLVDSDVISSLQKRLNSINSDIAEKEILELKTAISNLNSNDGNIVRTVQSITRLEDRINKIRNKEVDIIDDDELKQLQKAEEELNKLKNILSSLKGGEFIDGKAISNQINIATNSVRELERNFKDLEVASSGISETFKEIFSYTLGGSGIYLALNSLKESIHTTIELDDALRDLKRVTDLTEQQYREFMLTANATATSLGTTTTEVMNAVTMFSQLGYTFEESSEYLGKFSLILSNVADMSANDSSGIIVSILKGFQMELSEVERIVDVINESGNKFAIQSGELSNALKVGAASLSIAGNDLEQASALIISASEVMQDPVTVSQGLKTISMRLRGISEDGEELNAQMGELIEKMTGVKIETDNGELRSTYDILNEIGKVWDTLNTKQKALLSEEIAGKNRANIFASLMMNAESLEKAYETLKNSAGSAQKENEAFINSLSGRINALKSALTSISIQVIDSDMFKDLISGATNTIQIISGLIDKFGAFPTAISIATASFTIFNKSFRENISIITSAIPKIGELQDKYAHYISSLDIQIGKIKEDIKDKKDMIASNIKAGESTSALSKEMIGLQQQLALTTVKSIALKGSMILLQSVMSLGLSAIITGLTTAFTKLVDSMVTTDKELKEMSSTFLANKQSADEEIKSLESLVNKHKELTKELESNSLSEEEQKNKKQELLEVERQLADLLPECATGFDEEGKKIAQNTEEIEENIQKKKELATQEAVDLAKDYDAKSWAKLLSNYDEQKEKVKEIQKEYDKLADGQKDVKIFEKLTKEKEKLDEFKEEIKTATTLMNTFKEAGFSDDDIASLFFKNIYGAKTQKELYSQLKEVIDEYTKSIEKNTEKKKENTEVNPITSESAFEEISEALSSTEMSTQTATDIMNAFTNAIESGVEPAKALADAMNSIDAQSGLEEATKTYGKCIDEVANLYSIVEELNKEHTLTPEIISKVVKSYPEVGAAVTELSTLQDFLQNKINETMQKQSEAYSVMIGNDTQYYASKIANNNEFEQLINDSISAMVGTQAEQYNVDLSNFSTLNQLKQSIQDQFGETQAASISEILGLYMAAYTFDSQNFADLQSMKQGYINQLIPAIANWIANFTGGNAQGYSTDLANFNDLSEAKEYVLRQLNEKMKILKQNYDALIPVYNQVKGELLREAQITGDASILEAFENTTEFKEMEAITSQIKELEAGLNTVDKIFAGLEVQLNSYETNFKGSSFGGNIKDKGSSSKDKNKGSSNKDKEIEDLKVKFDKYKNLNSKIDQITNEIEKNRALQKTASGKQLEDLINQEKVLLEQKKQAQQNLTNELKKEQDEIKKVLANQNFVFDIDGNISNYEENLKRLEEWANSATAEEKERRKEIVEDLVDQIDRYYTLINNEISNADKTIIETSNEIFEIIKKQELEKIEAIKSASDSIFEAIDKKINEVDYQQNVDGEANADTMNTYYIKKLALIREQITQAEKDLAKYNEALTNSMTADAKAEALANIKEAEETILSYKDSLQSMREEYQSWIITMIQTPYNDKVWQLGTQKMNKIEFELEVVGEANAPKRFELMGRQLEIYKELSEAAKKNYDNLIHIRDNAELTADAQQELTQALKDAEEQMHSSNMELQQFREEYEKYLLEVMYKPYEDKMWQLGTQQMNKIEYKLEILDEKDTTSKMELLEEKLSLQQQIVDETNKYYKQLVHTRDNVALTEDAYSELIKQMMSAEETMHDQALALQSIKKEMEDLAKTTIEEYIDQLKELEELELDRKHKEEINNLGASFFKVSEEEYNKYKTLKENAIKTEIESLKAKLILDKDNLALQEQIKGLQIELYDLQNENYANITDWYALSEKIHNANIEAIEKELEALEEAEALEREREERLEKQNALIEAQQRLEEIKKNKNIRQLKKDANGEWNFEYTYDSKELADANKDYQEKLEDLREWEKELEKQKYKDKLQAQKEYEEEALNKLKEMYDKQLAELEKKQEAEKEALEQKYDDMLEDTSEYLEELKKLYGDNWGKIMEVLNEKLANGQANLTKFKQHTIDEANEAVKALNALMKYINEIDGSTITVFQKIESVDNDSILSGRMARVDTSVLDTKTQPVGDVNNYNINASFPNARNSYEIEQAFANIDTIAKQRVKKG